MLNCFPNTPAHCPAQLFLFNLIVFLFINHDCVAVSGCVVHCYKSSEAIINMINSTCCFCCYINSYIELVTKVPLVGHAFQSTLIVM